ncbi:MAG: hypothetical protein WCK96_18360 [Methylococcales bacterium]
MTKLLSKEIVPAGLSLYLDIPIGTHSSQTGVFFPAGYRFSSVDIHMVLYFHGHNSPPPDRYWKNQNFKLREEVNASNKANVVLVVPGINNSYAGTLQTVKGFDKYIDALLEGIMEHAGMCPYISLGRLTLAAHSGGGAPMLELVKTINTGSNAGSLSGCWGFDCLYGSGDPVVKTKPSIPPNVEEHWLESAKKNFDVSFEFFWVTHGPGTRSKNLQTFAKAANITNISVVESKGAIHDTVPIRNFKDCINRMYIP